MFSCVKCKKKEAGTNDTSTLSPRGVDHFCSVCFKAQMFDKYRREVSKSKLQIKKVEKILILHDRTYKSEILVNLIVTLWILDPNRKIIEKYYVYYVIPPADSQPEK